MRHKSSHGPVRRLATSAVGRLSFVRVYRAIRSFNGKPQATAFRNLHPLGDTDAFGLPLNEKHPTYYRPKHDSRGPKANFGVPSRLGGAVALILLLLAGCGGKPDIQTVYGQRTGIGGTASVNGTSVFAHMFEEAGFRVSSWRRLSPNLDQFDVIVWAPDDFAPPSARVRKFFRDWFWQQGNRTLIYIGRDYDAAITYWQKMQSDAPPEQAQEVARRLATAQADYFDTRSQMPDAEFCEWFTLRRDAAPRKIDSLAGELADGIDVGKVEIELRARFDEPKERDLDLLDVDSELGPDLFEQWESTRRGRRRWEDEPSGDHGSDMTPRVPSKTKVLLRSQTDALVTRVRDRYLRDTNQILVVTNGSFLLNLPLINHEHRKLAGRLIDLCGEPGKVAFLESGPDGLPILEDEPTSEMPTGLEVFTVWPIGCIVVHLAVVGIIFCFARFAIFGRPKELPADSVSDFRKHVDALGELLKKTADTTYAKERIHQYQQTVRGDPSNAPAGQSPTT